MLKKIFRASLVIMLVGTLFFLFPPHFLNASAEDTSFQVNIQEILSVSITTPTTNSWARGEVGQFLRNVVTVDVTSNNANGFVAGMKVNGTGALTHTTRNTLTLANLSSDWTRSDTTTTDFWGYSLNDNNETGTYHQVPTTTTKIFDNSASGTPSSHVSKDIYFGAKASTATASGTYAGTIVINVVSGMTSFPNPIPTPVEPSPERDATYNQDANATAYTYTTTSGSGATATTTTTTQVTPGDNESLYNGYTPPQGAIESTSSNVYDGSMLTTALAVTASVAAASGAVFFILAKRKKDDEEDEIE